MAMDAVDSRLLTGTVVFLLLGAGVCFLSWPFAGVRTQQEEEENTRVALSAYEPRLLEHYPPVSPAVWGRNEREMPDLLESGKVPVEQRRQALVQETASLKKQIAAKESECRVEFEKAEWTQIPEAERNPGVFFIETWDRIRNRLRTEWLNSDIKVDDGTIGFKDWEGRLNEPREFYQESMRKLYIAETVITLCIEAKKAQAAHEKLNGLKQEAFMRILSVKPEESVLRGPTVARPNPKYDRNVKNPRDERFEKFIIEKRTEFIRMYPVEIVLQCDVNTFMRFLHSVRKPGQFLVIRNLDLYAPAVDQSLRGRDSFPVFAGTVKDYLEEQILVKLSAAGMDFFEPVPPKAGQKTGKPADNNAPPPSAGKPPGYATPAGM